MDRTTSQPAPSGSEQRLRAVQEQIQSYYSNCAMLSPTPVDISLYFGKLVPVTREGGEQGLAEYYEKQIIMTVEQVKKLGYALLQTVQAIEASRRTATPAAPQQRPPQAQVPVGEPKRTETSPKRGAAPAGNDVDFEFEIPDSDLADEKARQAMRARRAARPRPPAQNMSPSENPYHEDF